MAITADRPAREGWRATLRARLEARPGYRWIVLVSVLLGLLSVNITFTIFNVALVDIAKDLHTTQNELTWAITGPLLLVGVAAPTAGRIGDMHGHRRLYLFGLSGAFLCAVLTASAHGVGWLIGARLLSGIEGACTTAASWSLLFRVFPPEDRTKVLGWWSLVGAGGPVLGVVLGGPVIQAYGWRWVFVVQAPLILLALLVNSIVLRETEPTAGERLDLFGALLLALGVGSLLFGLNKSTDWGWTSTGVLVSLALCPIAIGLFVLAEQRSDDPLLPPEWLRRRNFSLPCLSSLFANFAYMGGFFLTPLLLERGFGYSVSHAGFLQIARPLTFSIAAPVAGYLAVRTGERAASISGVSVIVLSMLVFASLEAPGNDAVIVLALALSGLGMGVAAPSLSASLANAVELARMGTASAAMQMMGQVGAVAGIQLMETVQVGRQHAAGVVGSFSEAYLVGAFAAGLGVVAAVFMRRTVPEQAPFVPVEPMVG
ncbi:MAG TPA: MFS transporter [Acidimicrobiales bacterium]|nr:MFS transporter [Acidimicrobiales bacterium]